MKPKPLIDRARAGDANALRELAKHEAPRVAGLLVRLLGPRNDLEDLVQTVFLEVCRSLPRFRGESTLSTFVGGITVHVARRAMKGSAWQRHRAAWPKAELSSEDSSPDAIADARQQLRRLHAMLEDVPAKKRIAFLLWAVDGMTAEEVAELTKSTVYTARKRIYDVRRQLRDLAAEDPELRMLVAEES